MNKVRIDLYSDTHTQPSNAMRQAIAAAEVGDEQHGTDPTTNRLQDMVAELLGKQAALFLPSGTMCNQIAYRIWCQPGDEIIADVTAHTIHSETGGPAAVAGAMMRTVDGTRGIFTADHVEAAIRPEKRNVPRSALVSVENTSNFGGGTVWPVEVLRDIHQRTQELGIKCHMDGARLLNAVVESGTSAADYAATQDSLWIDLSKGLGCPVGAVLAGDSDFIERAFRLKHLLGGAMRQSGIIAAAGVYALENNVDRMAEDHDNARHLAARLGNIPGIKLDPETVETNLVFFDVTDCPYTAKEITSHLMEHGIQMGARDDSQIRAVTHLDITREMVDEAVDVLGDILRG